MEPSAISLTELLAARDNRAARQRELLAAWPERTLLSLTVVLPGAVKRDERSLRVGEAGVAAVRETLQPLYEEIRDLGTGFEAFFIVAADRLAAKRRACRIEDTHPWGRLMDIDVLEADGDETVHPISRIAVGLPERRCLLCDRPARECMRARTHSPEALQAALDAILSK